MNLSLLCGIFGLLVISCLATVDSTATESESPTRTKSEIPQKEDNEGGKRKGGFDLKNPYDLSPEVVDQLKELLAQMDEEMKAKGYSWEQLQKDAENQANSKSKKDESARPKPQTWSDEEIQPEPEPQAQSDEEIQPESQAESDQDIQPESQADSDKEDQPESRVQDKENQPESRAQSKENQPNLDLDEVNPQVEDIKEDL